MALLKNLINAPEGQIDVDSWEGAGSKSRVLLPELKLKNKNRL